jgi:hypothetical protein
LVTKRVFFHFYLEICPIPCVVIYEGFLTNVIDSDSGMRTRTSIETQKVSTRTGERNVQAELLGALFTRRGVSAREVARRSADIAQRSGMSEFAVGHQAVSAWVKGTRHPNRNHRQLLASVLEVSIAEVNTACDAVDNGLIHREWKQSNLVVHGAAQNIQYTLPLKTDINLSLPAVYGHWSDMFCFRPVHLMRHFRKLSYDLYGWVPNDCAGPLIAYSPCLVPLERVTQRNALRILDTVNSAQRRVWFVYLPGGNLHVGIGHRDNGSFMLSHSNGDRLVTTTYPISKVDFAGYVTGKILFHLSGEVTEKRSAASDPSNKRSA